MFYHTCFFADSLFAYKSAISVARERLIAGRDCLTGFCPEAYQAEIDHIDFPENVDLYKFYNNMASLYWKANQPLKAIDAQQRAIADMKNRKKYSIATLAEYESKLQQYKVNPSGGHG